MKTIENQDHREVFIKCLQDLGLNIFTIHRFFRFLWNQNKETEALIEGIDGGVNMSGIGIGSGHIDRQYERKRIRDKAAMVTSLMIPVNILLEGERLDGDLEIIMAPKIESPTTGRKTRKIRNQLFKSFFSYFMYPEIDGEKEALLKFGKVVTHWRGLLDTYRVNLMLAGKRSFPEDIKEADLFLAILENQM